MQLSFALWLVWAFFARTQLFLWTFELGEILGKIFWFSLGGAVIFGWLAIQAEKAKVEVEDVIPSRFWPSTTHQPPNSSSSSDTSSEKPAVVPPPSTPQRCQRSSSPPRSQGDLEAAGVIESPERIASSPSGLYSREIRQLHTEKVLKKPRL